MMGARMKQLVLTASLVAATHCAIAQTEPADPLFTRSGWQVGRQFSTYHYVEPNFARLDGERSGAVATYTHSDSYRLFVQLEGRISYGLLRYEGSGVKQNNPDLIAEARALVGQDVAISDNLTFSPYAGLGYRHLYSDIRGYSSTNAVGYQRYSQYLYVPLGTTLRIKIRERTVFAPTVEFDVFLAGNQYSQLSDTGLGYSDASNNQYSGYGYRAYLMVETGEWSFGPWLHYWDIGISEITPQGFEPANWTREYGLELRLRF
jgi:hypothetical protein